MRISILIFALVLVGCERQTPTVPRPAPPIIQANPVPKVAPAHSGDITVHNCTVTKETDGHADCICRRANTHIDANDTSKQALVCR
jgi:hypothetical protein